MINSNNIIVFDFETGGLKPGYHEAIQIAAVVLNPRTLEQYPGAQFESLMRPLFPERLDPKALETNKKKPEDLAKAPHPREVWTNFAKFCKSYSTSGNMWGAPIPAGKNIRNFDMLFVDNLNKEYNKDQSFFHPKFAIDLEDLCFFWWESSQEPRKYGMDYLREWLGMSKENAHDAMVDVIQTAELIRRFMKLHRFYTKKIKWTN